MLTFLFFYFNKSHKKRETVLPFLQICYDKLVYYGRSQTNEKVITYGTFDLLHYGHVRLLKRAKELGDYLIVGLSTDEFNEFKNIKKHIIPILKESIFLKQSVTLIK